MTRCPPNFEKSKKQFVISGYAVFHSSWETIVEANTKEEALQIYHETNPNIFWGQEDIQSTNNDLEVEELET